MAVSGDEFRKALGSFPAGVTVVTLTNSAGEPRGITVTSFASVSLAPPLVLVCIDNGASMHGDFAVDGHFAVNMLRADQQNVSNQFASPVPDRFAGVEHTAAPGGSPLLAGAMTAIECRCTAALEGGDHTIFLGEVVYTQVSDAPPLVYCRGQYREITPGG
jgi:flavin reductase (DIM6/NTAB) family NADH-FMN oxidoreductase RutF